MSFSDIKQELVDSLLIFFRRIEELRRTRFFSFYRSNTSQVSLQFNNKRQFKISASELEDENDEFLRSFVAILRLFLLNIDKFSLQHLGENYFNPNQGLLYQLFPVESTLFNKLRSNLKDFLNSKPQLNITRSFLNKDYSFKSNLEILNNFAYGGLIHSNPDKLEKYFVFNLNVNEGQYAIVYQMYRNYIIYILLYIVSIINQISNIVIEKVISEILTYHIGKGNEYFNTNIKKANTHYNSALYIANRLEDYKNRIILHKTLAEINYALKDETLAKNHEIKAAEIKRVMEGLPPDFSDYNVSIDIKKRDEDQSKEDKE